jgi:transcriptional regulator with XRE-family HTH domain
MAVKSEGETPQEAWPELEALAANLRRLRLANGWTQGDVAEATGTSQGYVSAMENNQVNLGAQMLVTMARLFEVSVGRLFDVPPPAPLRPRPRPKIGEPIEVCKPGRPKKVERHGGASGA